MIRIDYSRREIEGTRSAVLKVTCDALGIMPQFTIAYGAVHTGQNFISPVCKF
jgi:ribosomal protein S19